VAYCAKVASALDQPQDSCLDGSYGADRLDRCRLVLLLKFTFGSTLLHFDDTGASVGMMIMMVTFIRISWKRLIHTSALLQLQDTMCACVEHSESEDQIA
jgi:hypothetical protein